MSSNLMRTAAGLTSVANETRLLTDRRTLFLTEITDESADDLIQKIMVLQMDDEAAPIDLYIRSNGGSVTAGLSLYDYIHAIQTPIRMYCLGNAYSMAAIIFASGLHGRYMYPNSELMLHEPLIQSARGSCSSIKSASDRMLYTKDRLDKLLSVHTGRTMDEVSAATSFDHFFSAEESLAFGLCDQIIQISGGKQP